MTDLQDTSERPEDAARMAQELIKALALVDQVSAERDQAHAERNRAKADLFDLVAERDQARAERDHERFRSDLGDLKYKRTCIELDRARVERDRLARAYTNVSDALDDQQDGHDGQYA